MAWRGAPEFKEKALGLLQNPSVVLIGSSLLRLETLPKAMFRQHTPEIRFLERAFEAIAEWVLVDEALVEEGVELGRRYDIVNLDALHVAAAIRAGADRFVTTEKSGKPLYRLTEIEVVYLLDL